ncbi:Putative lipoprotein [Chromobacterium vaccinii]|nr:Putative lipoprotein [Chromobacterium vaccinii]QND87578.1 Putative lipoprotein [Chromobacterium vaccinii]
MSYRLTLLALGAALLAGCASPTAPARQGPAPAMEQLQGEWKQTGAGDKGILLRIDQQRLFAKAGCNGMFGPAAIDGGKLRVERLASTLMMCPPEAMQRDAKLSRQLEAGMDVSLDGERLKLSDGKDALTFERQPQGEIKFIYVAAERKACTGVAPMQCLQVRADKSKPWELHYGEIEGFQPEPGVAYRLRIKEVKVDNPPADASSIRWILDLVVEQEVVKKP